MAISRSVGWGRTRDGRIFASSAITNPFEFTRTHASQRFTPASGNMFVPTVTTLTGEFRMAFQGLRSG